VTSLAFLLGFALGALVVLLGIVCALACIASERERRP
jgi:hypothetical protein